MLTVSSRATSPTVKSRSSSLISASLLSASRTAQRTLRASLAPHQFLVRPSLRRQHVSQRLPSAFPPSVLAHTWHALRALKRTFVRGSRIEQAFLGAQAPQFA